MLDSFCEGAVVAGVILRAVYRFRQDVVAKAPVRLRLFAGRCCVSVPGLSAEVNHDCGSAMRSPRWF
jgi:hypothetical protein